MISIFPIGVLLFTKNGKAIIFGRSFKTVLIKPEILNPDIVDW
jgi:hypothetical protein